MGVGGMEFGVPDPHFQGQGVWFGIRIHCTTIPLELATPVCPYCINVEPSHQTMESSP